MNFFLIQFESQQVVMVLAQLQEILDEVSRVRGQAIGQTILSCRSTPLRTLHQQSWVLPTRQSFSPAGRIDSRGPQEPALLTHCLGLSSCPGVSQLTIRILEGSTAHTQVPVARESENYC